MDITSYVHSVSQIIKYKRSLLSGLICFLVVSLFLQISWANFEIVRMKFSHITSYPFRENSEPREHELGIQCVDRQAVKFDRVEDIFCITLPQFVPSLKNPCFYDVYQNGTKTLRCLPYFYIIGMDKSGTTDLHNRMIKHPQILGNRAYLKKETSFWCWKRFGIYNKRKIPKTTFEQYIDMFNNTAEYIKAKKFSVITGDATPMDLWDFRGWPQIPQNSGLKEPSVLTPHFLKYIHKGAPKILIQFREPVERLYSDYVFLKYGKDPTTFHFHVLEAIKMMNACLKNDTRRNCHFSFQLYQKIPARIHLGCYSVFLKEWLAVFPRETFHITRTDEYQNNMGETLRSIFKFLDVVPLSDKELAPLVTASRRHVTANKTGILLPETKRILRQYYKRCNEEMAELLQDKRFLWLDHYSEFN